MTDRIKLPRTPKRLDPIPGQSTLDEQLLGMIVGLASETAILRARLDACERLLAEASKDERRGLLAGVLAPGAIDAFSPDEPTQKEREEQRHRILRKVFRPLQEAASAELAAIQTHEE